MVRGGERFHEIIGKVHSSMATHISHLPEENAKMKQFFETLPMSDPDIDPSLVKGCSFEELSAPQFLTWILFDCFPIIIGNPRTLELR
jgi:hypothetical protein